ncbi:hypothetical protein FQN60_011780 [Etheostoma spectabile]|uniref:Uncharacterized protein n=1 Tax=Etheostoma spectabile TaxID=54343 RepID=A0A5J5DMU9_9PERO|nr:hypothetical protein FQN60_011780 [Etheostoma spectabile]
MFMSYIVVDHSPLLRYLHHNPGIIIIRLNIISFEYSYHPFTIIEMMAAPQRFG